MNHPRQPSFVARRPPAGTVGGAVDPPARRSPRPIGEHGLSRRDLLGHVGRLVVIGGGIAAASPLLARTPAHADHLLEPSYFDPKPPAPLVVIPAGVPAIDGPALARSGGTYIAWTDPDHELHVQRVANPGGLSTGNTRVNQQSAHAPALAFVGNRLFLAWTGVDADSSLNLAQLTTNTGTPKITGSIETLDQTSPYGPALTSRQGQLWLAWTGSGDDHSLNVQRFDPSPLQAHADKTELTDETSSGSPALAASGSRLYLAWAGTDEEHTLNLARSSTPDDAGSFTKTIFDNETSDVGAAVSDSGSLVLAWRGTDAASLLNTAEPLASNPFKNVYNESAAGPPAVLDLPQDKLALAWVNPIGELTWGRTL